MLTDQRAYVCQIAQRLMRCDPNGGYALFICPGCRYGIAYLFLPDSLLPLLWQGPASRTQDRA